MKPWLDSRNRYLMIGLSLHGKSIKKLVHRLVAEAFVPNPNNLPEVNHIDRNPQNPKAENLEWCTRKENLEYSYVTMSPVRNYKMCSLYYDNRFVDDFISINAAARFGQKKFGCSKSSLVKYKQNRECKILFN